MALIVADTLNFNAVKANVFLESLLNHYLSTIQEVTKSNQRVKS